MNTKHSLHTAWIYVKSLNCVKLLYLNSKLTCDEEIIAWHKAGFQKQAILNKRLITGLLEQYC